jgi:segregation and condensation protein B
VLSPRQIDEWLNRAANVTPPADAEMGLPLEEGEGESPSLEPVEIEHVEGSAPASEPVEAPVEESIEGDAPSSALDAVPDESTDSTESDETKNEPAA